MRMTDGKKFRMRPLSMGVETRENITSLLVNTSKQMSIAMLQIQECCGRRFQHWWQILLRKICWLRNRMRKLWCLIMFYFICCVTVWNVSKWEAFSGRYFPAFGLNTERYFVSLLIQSKCGKIQTRKNSVFGLFSRSVCFTDLIKFSIKVICLCC